MEETNGSNNSNNDQLISPVKEAPNGPGWMKLSDKIYILNSQPLQTGGRVYKGKQKIVNEWREVAVKFVPYNEENWKEVELILKLDKHPYVVKILDAGKTNDIIPNMYIVMEFCFQSLRDYIDEHEGNPVNFETAYLFTKQIFEAILFIHGKNILHRDIKLDNILLLTPQGPIKVADFGISKELTKSRSKTTCSVRGLGSDGYIAPELYGIDAKSSVYSDVFALGVMTYEIFTSGKHPFGSDPLRWRTNIIDNKSREYLAIPQFEEPFTSKRAQLKDLLDMSLQHKACDRPMVKDLLKHPFFTDLDETQGIKIGTVIAKNFVMGNGSIETHDTHCNDSIQAEVSGDQTKYVTPTSKNLEDQNVSKTVTWSKFVNEVEDVTVLQPITVCYAGNTINCSVSPRFRNFQLKWSGRCRDQKYGEVETAGDFESPRTAARRAVTLLVKKMISKELYPPPSDPENLDALF